MQTTPVILTDFQDYYLTEPVDQQQLIQHLAYMMATSRCVHERITTSAEANHIYQQMLTNVNKYAVSPNLIHSRQYNFLPEKVSDDNSAGVTTKFSKTHENIRENPNGLTIDERMRLFEESSIKVLKKAYNSAENLPDSIVHTTCSGYLSPSPVQIHFSNNHWLETSITHAYHMGCYAAIPSVEIAIGLVSASHNSLAKPRKRVDVIHTEMVSVHLNAFDQSPGNIINMTLFGDGFVKYSALPEHEFSKQNRHGLKILAVETMLLPKSLGEMTWIPGPFQFDMYISKNIPLLIGDNIWTFMRRLCNQVDINFDEQKDKINYAIHPGGPKILNYIEEKLNLDESKMRFSRNVFYKLGNMSSATLPHVWKDIISSDEIKPGEKVISVAFGPGLTATGLIFEKV